MFHASLMRLLLVPLTMVFAASTITAARASPPMSASGTFAYTATTFNSMRPAGGNTIIDLTSTVSYTGTLLGTSTVRGTLIIHADGTANFHDVETFSGTVNGVPGTATFSLQGTGSVAPSPGSFQGVDTVISGTGELASLHGVLTEVGTVPEALPGPLGTYTGQIQSG